MSSVFSHQKKKTKTSFGIAAVVTNTKLQVFIPGGDCLEDHPGK